ncbi:hypothetical protein T492DRAFT_875458 [Pavlovales sp. CCMP2436]|nr:hypothetical protein T492DRAFT_875458 [Pavlovales sp. CCMP2436]
MVYQLRHLVDVVDDKEAENKALESLRNAGSPDRRGPQRGGAVEGLVEEEAEGAETSSASELQRQPRRGAVDEVVDEASVMEPARPEPARPEPARPEPARPEPARPEPARPEPARPEPARSELARLELAHDPSPHMHSLAFVLLASALAAPVPRRLNEALQPVNLGTAGDFVLLTKSGISSVPASVIVGDIGVSPISATAMTGFLMTADSSNTFSTSAQLTGKAFAADFVSPTPSKMTTAIGDMETAYTDAASRPFSNDTNLNVMAGLITGTTFTPGVYTWGSDVAFSSDIYLSGSADDIFIFQTSGNVVVGAGAKVILIPDGSGGGTPTAATIVWQVAGYLKVDAGAHLETAATLISTTIIEPVALSGAHNASIGTD